MNRSFSSRLFGQLLLFALAPTIIMALAGYYLASQSEELTKRGRAGSQSSLVEYYNDLLYAKIEAGLERLEQELTIDQELIDFSFTINEPLTAHQPLDSITHHALTRSARQQSRGWVESGSKHYQFVTRITGEDTLCGGLIHNQTFGALVGSLDEERSQRGLNRILREEYLWFLLLLFGLLMTLTAGLAYLLAGRSSRQLARPLEELALAAQQIARGSFDQRVTTGSSGEIKELIESFNSMAAQLDQMTQRLTQSERVAAWRQVARRFAHELKNPIQPILISLYRMEKKLTGTPLYAEVSQPLKAATEELNHLVELAERFSSLAKLPRTRLEQVDLTQAVKSIGELYQEELSGFDFVVDLPGQPLYAMVDETSLREALINIILNARDACQAGSRIKLSLSETEDRIEIAVIDQGVGMDQATLTQARLPYFTTKAKGSGLGLAIVERSVTEMNGHVRVISSPGEGTTVSLAFDKI